jgi:hypothetical protein
MVGYDKFITPQMDGDKPVNVSAGLSVASMDMDDQGILNCVIWFLGSWQDDRLAWDPQDYCGKKEMRIPAKMLWIPDLEFYNALDYGGGYFSNSFLRRRNHLAIVTSTGMVLYMPPTKLRIRCYEYAYENWPWGDYNCNIKLGPWTHTGQQFDLNPYGDIKYLDMEDLSPLIFTEGSFEYEPLEINLYECCPEKYVSLNWHFKVKTMWRFTPKGYEKNPNEFIPFQGKHLKL